MKNLIRVKIKSFYRKLIIFLYLVIYKKPIYKKKINLENFNFTELKIDKKLYRIYELDRGRVFTNKNDITAYITKANFLTEGSMQFKKFDAINSRNQGLDKNLVLKNGTPNVKKHIKGNVLSLLSGGASTNNFTHWFTDVVPRIILFKKKFNLKKIDKFYVPSVKFKFQVESLNLLNIKPSQLISSESIKHIHAKKIYYTSHPCHFYPSKAQKWSLVSLRKLYLPKKLKRNKKFKYIYIDRDQLKLIDKDNLKKYASWRVLLNEDEIRTYLKSTGFKIIKPENFSFKEQIHIFNSAEVIVSLFGAAMMMITFCNSNAKILEIKPEKSGNEFKNISNKLNLLHEQIKVKPKYKSSTPQNGLLFCNLNIIKNKLKKLKI